METPLIEKASVKIMRSYDWCHFEFILSTTATTAVLSLEEVDALRKEVARLADKAVEQYKIYKINAARLLNEKQTRQFVVDGIKRIRATPEGDRTVREQAELKAYDDSAWAASRGYDYEDDWQNDDPV